MPFTISHGAAVLPLRRTRLIWSALLIGSFGPDFQYFLKMAGSSRSWHYYPALLTRCLPFTVIAFLAFQLFIRIPAAGLLPQGFQRRLDLSKPLIPRVFGDWITLLASLLIGIASHIVWDSFTHPFTWPWRHIHLLRVRVVTGPPPHYVFEYAQGLSTVVGLLLLGIVLQRWYRRTPPTQPLKSSLSNGAKIAICAEIIAVSLAGGIWRAVTVAAPLHGIARRTTIPVVFVIATMAWFMWMMLAFGMFTTFSQRRANSKTGAHS